MAISSELRSFSLLFFSVALCRFIFLISRSSRAARFASPLFAKTSARSVSAFKSFESILNATFRSLSASVKVSESSVSIVSFRSNVSESRVFGVSLSESHRDALVSERVDALVPESAVSFSPESFPPGKSLRPEIFPSIRFKFFPASKPPSKLARTSQPDSNSAALRATFRDSK